MYSGDNSCFYEMCQTFDRVCLTVVSLSVVLVVSWVFFVVVYCCYAYKHHICCYRRGSNFYRRCITPREDEEAATREPKDIEDFARNHRNDTSFNDTGRSGGHSAAARQITGDKVTNVQPELDANSERICGDSEKDTDSEICSSVDSLMTDDGLSVRSSQCLYGRPACSSSEYVEELVQVHERGKVNKQDVSETESASVDKGEEGNNPVAQSEPSLITVQSFGKNEAFLKTILDEIMKQLREKFGMEISHVQIEDVRNIDPEKPLLICCVTTSRLGTDVECTMKGIKTNLRKTVLIVVHHKEKHAQPSAKSQEKLSKDDLRGIEKVIDIAGTTECGMYECEMNDIGLKEITEYLAMYFKQNRQCDTDELNN